MTARERANDMAAKTILESSESFASPNGSCTVAVSSRTDGPDRGLSQAVVSEPNGGSGLIAFYLPRISMGFVWKSDDELVVRYPNDLLPPRIDATNQSFGRGGRGRVVYEAVPRSAIRPLRWTRNGELACVAEEPLERGVLLTFETDKRIDYSYSYYDVSEPDSSAAALQNAGLQGGGETWASIIHGLVALRAPEIVGEIELDPEADGLAVRSSRRDALVTVAGLVAAAKRDKGLLEAAIERARLDDELE